MMSAHWFFIINPTSGKGKGLSIWKQVEEKLKASGINYTHAISEYHQHATQIISNAYEKGNRQFIGLGGDGTLNEMINGIFHAKNFDSNSPGTLQLIPIGTGNDWVRNHDALTMDNVIERIQKNEVTGHDVGLITPEKQSTRYFLNVAGGGLDGSVAKEIGELNAKGEKNQFSYLKGTIKALFHFKAPKTKVTIDGVVTTHSPMLLTAGSIGRYFGNGMLISPNAHYQNGALTITLVKEDKNWIIFPQLYKLFNGQIGSASFVEKHTAKELLMKSEFPVTLQADGETLGEHSTVTFSVLKHAINILL